MEKKILNIVQCVASVLSSEKAYEIPNICERFDIGDGTTYSAPASKEKFLASLIKQKNDKFIIELAKRIVDEYEADSVGLALNDYYNGKFYKVSIITRQHLLADLFMLQNLEGTRSVDEFLKGCGFSFRAPLDFESIFAMLSPGISANTTKSEPDLIEILKSMNIHEMLDKRVFRFLEQLVHPYVRSNVDATKFLSVINNYLQRDGHRLEPIDNISGQLIYKVSEKKGVDEAIKNLIFSADGYKPEIVLEDALSNRIKIVKNAEFCLVYDRPIKHSGLLWVDLMEWWTEKNETSRSIEEARILKDRLFRSLDSAPEKVLFNTYYQVMSKLLGKALPVLIPQIYLHYDPYSVEKFGVSYLLRQRMDFLLLLSNNVRVVIEVDGKQHYAEKDIASPAKYAEMVSQDRDLKLLGYEVYRFGGYELIESNKEMIISFFTRLFERHNVR